MGFDATSGEGNTTGQPLQTQALSFAGSTAKPQRPGENGGTCKHFQK